MSGSPTLHAPPELHRRPPPGSTARRPSRRAGPAPSDVITLLTDFGLQDPYVGVVKGVLLSIHPRARLVDLTHAIPPQDVLRGALALESAYRFFPGGTVHLAVVDPGVGGARRPLVVEAEGHRFVGPDNGLLSFLLESPGVRVVTPTDAAFHRTPASRTFHARDLFAPVAAHCALGVSLDRLGPAVGDPVRLDWPRPKRTGGAIVGEVLYADRFGNLLTNIPAAALAEVTAGYRVEVAGRSLGELVAAYVERPVGALGALIDSSGRVEIFVRDGSAAARLRAGPGTLVRLSPSPTRPGSARRPSRFRTRSMTPRRSTS